MNHECNRLKRRAPSRAGSPTSSAPGWVRRSRALASLGVLVLPLLAGVASAETKTVEAYVVGVQGEDLIIDLPPESGVRVGSEVEIWRSLSLRHPVTGEEISDKYRFGVLRVTQVMTQTSMTRAQGKLERDPVAGDLIRYSFEVPETASEAHAQAHAPAAAEATSDEKEIADLLATVQGQAPATRAQAYETYVRAHPSSPFRRVLLEEAVLLRRVLKQGPRGSEPLMVQKQAPTNRARLEVPRILQADLGVQLSLQLDEPVRGVLLHHRSDHRAAFETLELHPGLGTFYTGVLEPKDLEGKLLEFFVEVVGEDGQALSALGTAKSPLRAAVVAPPRVREPLKHTTTVQLSTDYADFNRLRGNDTAWQTEGGFRLRFGDRGLRALSSSFGVYRGKGGSVEALDSLGASPQSVGLTYGTVGAELGVTPRFGLIAVGTVGLADPGVRGGVQGHLRVGSDLDTNLTVGGEILGGIGVRGIAQFELRPQSRLPLLIRSEVTNQPAGSLSQSSTPTPDPSAVEAFAAPTLGDGESGDVGVRGILQLGYRLTEGFVVAGRVSYQGRNIRHSGPGFGGGVSYSW